MTELSDILQKYPSSLFTREEDSQIGKKWKADLELLNEVRNVFESSKGATDFRTQSGAILDLIGKNLKQPRDGMDDFRYRVFLSIARQKRKSKGDIHSMNEIGSQILAGTGTLYEIQELCYGGEPLLLDGLITFNGEYPLSGNTKRPATIRVIFTGSVDTVVVTPEFNKAISQIRAGGVNSIINYRFETSTLSGRLYNSALRTSALDVTWAMNGVTILSIPNAKILPDQIAFGIGGLSSGTPRIPQAGDTGLQNEVLRKSITIQNNPDGSRIFKASIKQAEAIGAGINELGLFDRDGNLLFLKTFPSKPKDNLIVYDFAIHEEFE
ncbi:phage tail protein [Leptospira barantonii]|uniref:Phage tail protein n=1 Tax=Leptospira barantonii TaxID=2023184 RepID=A0ABX4NM59_9LEPT|nr:phage tail protein [Leptospira barantonii]PJZ57889.1 phage tail protein [Leptospira barantonii]